MPATTRCPAATIRCVRITTRSAAATTRCGITTLRCPRATALCAPATVHCAAWQGWRVRPIFGKVGRDPPCAPSGLQPTPRLTTRHPPHVIPLPLCAFALIPLSQFLFSAFSFSAFTFQCPSRHPPPATLFCCWGQKYMVTIW